jgi:pimeloyl-ACP methyl ester carboxylesterase
MQRLALALVLAFAFAVPASAKIVPFPKSFAVKDIASNGTTIHLRVGGHGPAVLLLHGFGDTGDMWAPIAARLAADHMVIVPDLRGMGSSAHPEDGYTKKNQARDIAGVLDALKVDRFALVTHDIGNMVGFAIVALYQPRVTKWIVIDAPLPGLGNWAAQLTNPKTWHFNFYGPDEERLVKGRERIYLDRFWNELSDDPRRIDEATRRYYTAIYAKPHAIHDAFEQFKAFLIDAKDNPELLKAVPGGKLSIPVLALGGEKSYGAHMADELRSIATNVQGGVIPKSGHWVMEENPDETTRMVLAFLAKP